jgi:8-oxo-dGTP diphosphatase
VNSSREYPERPVVGVGGVIVHEGRVVLIKRAYEPLKGHWSLPGGGVEVGETLEAAVAREMLEETGLEVSVGPVIEVFDRITRDEQRRVRYHYVLVDYLCWSTAGTLRAGGDVDDAVLAAPADLGRFELTDKTIAVIARALELNAEAPGAVR